ncbi:NACHT domain-and WD repeat-containing protein 1 [Trichonephila clavipes]|nr:NACHT domain-and WD repeat-containing protein 1 [Trichonephila clavipes]
MVFRSFCFEASRQKPIVTWHGRRDRGGFVSNDPTVSQYMDVSSQENFTMDEESAANLQNLIDDVIFSVGRKNIHFFNVEWKEGGLDTTHNEHRFYLEKFGNAIFTNIKVLVDEDIAATTPDWQNLPPRIRKPIQEVVRESQSHLSNSRQHLRALGVSQSLDSDCGALLQIQNLMLGQDDTCIRHSPVIVCGQDGSGKSTLLSQEKSDLRTHSTQNLKPLLLIDIKKFDKRVSFAEERSIKDAPRADFPEIRGEMGLQTGSVIQIYMYGDKGGKNRLGQRYSTCSPRACFSGPVMAHGSEKSTYVRTWTPWWVEAHQSKVVFALIDPVLLCQGKDLVLPTLNVDQISQHTRLLLLSFQNNEMSNKSAFAVHKARIGIGGEPKSVKRLRSGDLLMETNFTIQTKSFLHTKSFLNCPRTVASHKFLNSSRGVISEPDLLCTSEAEIHDGFSDQGVIQVRRIMIKKETFIPTKHVILTFNSPRLPTTIKAGYLNCKIRPNLYQTLCAVSKARVPQLIQTYAQATKPSTISTTIQTDTNITNIICPPLKCLKPVSSANPMPSTSSSVSTVSTSSSPSQAHLLPSTSSVIPTMQNQSPLPIRISTTATLDNSLNTSASSLSTETRLFATTSNKFSPLSTEVQPLVPLPQSAATTSNSKPSDTSKIPKNVKQNSKNRSKRT